MRPLILNFAETPDSEDLDFSLIEYSKEQNLSVLKGTAKPAISYLSLGTQTYTRTSGEATDSDMDCNNNLKTLLDTRTRSSSNSEFTDSDFEHRNVARLLDTTTQTKMSEESDSDR